VPGDEVWIDRGFCGFEHGGECAIFPVGIDFVDVLGSVVFDSGTESTAQHREGGEVDLGIAMGVRIMLFEIEVRLIV